jgi:hypothetical protein
MVEIGATEEEPEIAGAEDVEALPYPTGLVLLTLENRASTAIYWVSVIAVALSTFLVAIPPMVDYPQHLGMAELAHRMSDPSSPLHESFTLNYFTYNALFHWLVAQLGHLMPVEIAGRLVAGAALALLAGANVALLRTLGRPPSYAALFVPVLFASAVVWGFLNYALGVAIGVTALVWIARAIMRPGVVAPLVVGVLSLVCGFCHVLATLLLCALALAFAPEIAWRATRKLAGWRRIASGVRRAFVALAPLLTGAIFCIAVYLQQYQWNPASYSDPTLEGSGPPVEYRLWWFAPYTTGLHGDDTDQVLLLASVALALTVLVGGLWRRVPGDHPLVLPALATFGIYLWIPMVFIGTHIIFPRFGQTVVFGLLFLLPALAPRWAGMVRRLALALAVVTAINLAGHMVWFGVESRGLSEVLDALPGDRKVTAVVYEPSTTAFRNGVLIHIAAYHGARNGGEWAFNFARYQSVPLNFKPYTQPGWPREGWEFFPEEYNPRCWYARSYDVVLVQAPMYMVDYPDGPVRTLVFGPDADLVQLIARSGRYFAFDTKDVPYDGTP